MNRILLISDDPERSRGQAQHLEGDLACEIHDLYDDTLPSGPIDAFVADVRDLDGGAVARLRRLLGTGRQRVPFALQLHSDTPRARMLGVALGATHTLSAPFDLMHAIDVMGVANQGVPREAVRAAEEMRAFYMTVFVPDRPITSGIIDNGVEVIDLAIRDTGIRDWIRAVQCFDDATHQHCMLVAGLASAFAKSLGLGPQERHRLTRAALMHDVGKIHIPASILNKPGRLDEAELAVMRLHPKKGYDTLVDQGFEPELLTVVLSHHEMLDGSGYPDKLKAHAIPDLVRLVTVCDIFGALIERRSYKPTMPSMKAYRILLEMTGRLDQALVNAFLPVATSLNAATSDERLSCMSP